MFRNHLGWLLGAASLLVCGCTAQQDLGSHPGGSGGTLNGTWDITDADGAVGPSEMTINGGSVTGFTASAYEGKIDSATGCTNKKRRTEFTINAEGNALSATITDVIELSGTSCATPNVKPTRTLAGTRTKVAAASDTDVNGEWEVQDSKSGYPFIVTIDGLTAQGIDKREKAAGKSPELTVSVAGGLASVASPKGGFSFAARKR